MLASLAREKSFAAGEPLFHEGDRCEGIFIIASGRVKIYKTSPSGREMTIAVDDAPSTVAEIPIFDGGPYPASVRAMSETTVLFIDKRDVHHVCRRYPELPLKVLAIIGGRLRQLVAVIESITFGGVRQRLAKLLLDAAEAEEGKYVSLQMTHQELASRLGTVREVVSRNLSRFQQEGLIRIEARRVRILDPAGLNRESETEL